MKVEIESHYRNSVESKWVHIGFGSYGFRLPVEIARRLLRALTDYYAGSLKMMGPATEESLRRFFTDDPDVKLWDIRPMNPHVGQYTNGRIGFQFNDGTGYFELDDNEGKEFLKKLDAVLS